MQRVYLDKKAAAVKNFVRSLSLETDGLELEIQGKVVCRVTRPTQLTDAEKQELLAKVRDQIRRSHERNKDTPTRVIARKVAEAVEAVIGICDEGPDTSLADRHDELAYELKPQV